MLALAAVLGLLAGIGYYSLAPTIAPGPRAAPLTRPAGTSHVVATMRFKSGRWLDVWAPPRRPQAAPVIVMVHSCCGDRADLGKLAEALAARTIVFNADWAGIRPGSRFPNAYDDIGCALAFAQAHAARFGGDPGRLALLGWGDGAMAAAVVAANPRGYLPMTCTVRSPATPPRAFVGVAGFYGWPVPVPAQYVNPRSNSFFGGGPRRAPRAWRTASPFSQLRHAVGCTTLLVGHTDPLRAGARRYARALERAHNRVRLVVAPNAGDQSMISPRTQEGRTTVRETIAATSCPAAPSRRAPVSWVLGLAPELAGILVPPAIDCVCRAGQQFCRAQDEFEKVPRVLRRRSQPNQMRFQQRFPRHRSDVTYPSSRLHA